MSAVLSFPLSHQFKFLGPEGAPLDMLLLAFTAFKPDVDLFGLLDDFGARPGESPVSLDDTEISPLPAFEGSPLPALDHMNLVLLVGLAVGAVGHNFLGHFHLSHPFVRF